MEDPVSNMRLAGARKWQAPSLLLLWQVFLNSLNSHEKLLYSILFSSPASNSTEQRDISFVRDTGSS